MAALTITSLRESFVDFTEPYLNLGISILYKVKITFKLFRIRYIIIIKFKWKKKRPEKKKNEIFQFLSPLDYTVWIMVLACYIGKILF